MGRPLSDGREAWAGSRSPVQRLKVERRFPAAILGTPSPRLCGPKLCCWVTEAWPAAFVISGVPSNMRVMPGIGGTVRTVIVTGQGLRCGWGRAGNGGVGAGAGVGRGAGPRAGFGRGFGGG